MSLKVPLHSFKTTYDEFGVPPINSAFKEFEDETSSQIPIDPVTGNYSFHPRAMNDKKRKLMEKETMKQFRDTEVPTLDTYIPQVPVSSNKKQKIKNDITKVENPKYLNIPNLWNVVDMKPTNNIYNLNNVLETYEQQRNEKVKEFFMELKDITIEKIQNNISLVQCMMGPFLRGKEIDVAIKIYKKLMFTVTMKRRTTKLNEDQLQMMHILKNQFNYVIKQLEMVKQHTT